MSECSDGGGGAAGSDADEDGGNEDSGYSDAYASDDAAGRGAGADASDSGGSDDDDDAMRDASSDDEDRDLMVEIGVRQGRWERHEAELEKVRRADEEENIAADIVTPLCTHRRRYNTRPLVRIPPLPPPKRHPPQAAAEATALSMEQAAARRRQIFTSAEGFAMLSKELLAIVRRQDPALFADSVGDDV